MRVSPDRPLLCGLRHRQSRTRSLLRRSRVKYRLKAANVGHRCELDPDRNRPTHLSLRLSLIHISEPTRLGMISYAVFCLKKKKNIKKKKNDINNIIIKKKSTQKLQQH